MNEGEIGHHHAKCLGPIHSAENLSSDSFQLIGNLVGQGKDERCVNALKWNVQPLVVVEGKELRLRGLGFETHDDVLGEGVLSPDFEHGKKLAEMALGEFVIDGEPELSALLCGRNDSALWSGYGLLRSGHLVSLLRSILQHTCMNVEDHALTDSNQRSSREGNTGGVVGSLHEEGRDSNQMNYNKSNRGEGGRKGDWPKAS
jgi:hypothetical protein